MPLIAQLHDIDTDHTHALFGRDAAWLLEELLDGDYDWDSAIVRITRTSNGEVEFTRLETYRRTPQEVTPPAQVPGLKARIK